MQEKSRFRIGEPSAAVPKDPESLFRDLKQRSPKIPYLWSHQADILRTWHQNYQTSKDIALELPTGTGKTLAYLIPAIEWAVQNEKKVIVSTNTINLQEQLLNKDIPIVSSFESREFGFIPWEKQIFMKRHMGFKNPEILRDYLVKNAPRHLYSSGSLYLQPEAQQMESKI